MSMFDRLIPGRSKANLRISIEGIHQVALREVQRQEMTPVSALLWKPMCEGARATLNQLFIDTSDKYMDWGLKNKRHKIGEPHAAVLYWWMVLYQMVMFKNRGISGICVDEAFDDLLLVSDGFLAHLSSPGQYNFKSPGPWDDRWKTQVPLEATLGFYNRMMLMLRLHVDRDQRVYRVSLFTSAMERDYDENIRAGLADRIQSC